jgi:hypothetical protein
MAVGTHIHLFVLGVGNPIVVIDMARLGARRGAIRGSADVGKPQYGGMFKI